MTNSAARRIVSLALLLAGCGGAAEPPGDASPGDGGLDAALADGAAYEPGDAARPPPSCGVPIRQLTIGGPRLEDTPGVVAGTGDTLVGVMPLYVPDSGPRPLRIVEVSLPDGAAREASTPLPDGEWTLLAVAALDRPTALLGTVGGFDRFLWAELGHGTVDLLPLGAPSGLEPHDGDLPVSDGASFLGLVRLDAAVAMMRVARHGIDVVAVDTPPGSSRHRIAGSAEAGSVFMAAQGFSSEPRVEVARIGEDGSLIAGWRRVVEGEPRVSLQATADGALVTAAFEDEVVVVRLDGELTETERLHLPLEGIVYTRIIEAPTPALLAKRHSSYSDTVLFGQLPGLEDLRALADARDRSVQPLGWARGEDGYAVAVPGAVTDVYLLCGEP